MFDFTGKNVIVTGAGSGIGKCVALEYAKYGANVWVGDISETGSKQTLEKMEAYGHSYGFTRMDISKKDQVQKMYDDALGVFGTVDVIANCAGTFLDRHIFEATPEELERSIGINVLGVVYSCQIGMEQMICQGKGGAVVNLASVGGRQGDKGFPYYAMGKSAVIHFTQSAALNGADHNIKVNCVCPGIVRTPMWEVVLDAEHTDKSVSREELFNEILKSRIPLGRPQTSEDIANAVLFLTSAYADNITGQALNVCGGDAMN